MTLKRSVKSEEERAMLQALLGSDTLREILSVQLARRGDPHPSIFFEKPTEARP